MGGDVFPSTERTWIGEQLARGDGGRDEVNRHVMRVYAQPLEVYFRGTPDRQWLEPREAVNGFLADRLDRPGFFSDWRGSGLRLRRWLMTAFVFYLKEQRRVRNRTIPPTVVDDVPIHGEPEAALEQAFAVSLVREALRRGHQACADGGYREHWEVFERHYLHGLPHSAIERQFGIDARRSAVMVRTAANRFRAAVWDLLAADGVAPGDIESEIKTLLREG